MMQKYTIVLQIASSYTSKNHHNSSSSTTMNTIHSLPDDLLRVVFGYLHFPECHGTSIVLTKGISLNIGFKSCIFEWFLQVSRRFDKQMAVAAQDDRFWRNLTREELQTYYEHSNGIMTSQDYYVINHYPISYLRPFIISQQFERMINEIAPTALYTTLRLFHTDLQKDKNTYPARDTSFKLKSLDQKPDFTLFKSFELYAAYQILISFATDPNRRFFRSPRNDFFQYVQTCENVEDEVNLAKNVLYFFESASSKSLEQVADAAAVLSALSDADKDHMGFTALTEEALRLLQELPRRYPLISKSLFSSHF